MIPTTRFEYKYPLSPKEYLQVRGALVPYTTLYEFSRPRGKYLVRSLYYDTMDFQAYSEKITGERNRIKLRLRSYARNLKDCAFINVEIKTRSGNHVGKYATRVSVGAYEHFVRTGHWEVESNPVLMEFERLVRLRHLTPKTIVEYEREALIPRDREGVRVTFDHSIRYGVADDLFSDRVFLRPHGKAIIVMENKWSESRPRWLGNIILSHGLKAIPNSKYAHAIQHAEHRVFLQR